MIDSYGKLKMIDLNLLTVLLRHVDVGISNMNQTILMKWWFLFCFFPCISCVLLFNC